MKLLKQIVFLMALSGSLSVNASILTVDLGKAPSDKTYSLRYFPYKGDLNSGVKVPLTPDENGIFHLDSIRKTDMPTIPAMIYSEDEKTYILLSPTEELKVEIKGDGIISKGKYAKESDYYDMLQKTIDFDKYYPWPEENDTLPLSKKQEILSEDISKLNSIMSKLNDSCVKSFLKDLTQAADLSYSIRFEEDTLKQNALFDKIDLNSWPGLYYYLPLWKIKESLPEADFDNNTVPYGLAYIDSIKKNVTDEAVREAMLDDCAKMVLNWGKCPDVDAFWQPFVDIAGTDSYLYRKYSGKVKSIKATKSGAQGIDILVSDIDDKSHKLSDHYGKVIYIDCWATWCGPCRKEIPPLATHVEYFKNDPRIEFISFSMDENVNAWKKLLKKENPQWTQYILPADSKKEFDEFYAVSGIPRFIILNADGTIADADAFRPSDPDFRERLTEIADRNFKTSL